MYVCVVTVWGHLTQASDYQENLSLVNDSTGIVAHLICRFCDNKDESPGHIHTCKLLGIMHIRMKRLGVYAGKETILYD